MNIKINQKLYNLEHFNDGSFTNLYKGLNKKSQTHILIKLLSKRYSNNLTILKRLALEHEIITSLQKEVHFPSLLRQGTYDERPYIAYTFIEGTPLIHQLKKWDKLYFNPSYCCKLLKQILKIVSILHNFKIPIIHSDISPENILINNDKIYLIDFGCAQYLNDNKLVSKWIGKPSYLSPEQARGEKWGMQSDIYQIGIIFYECLTGKKWNLGKTQKQKITYASNPQSIIYNDIPIFLRPLLRSMLNVKLTTRESDINSCLRKLIIAMRAVKS